MRNGATAYWSVLSTPPPTLLHSTESKNRVLTPQLFCSGLLGFGPSVDGKDTWPVLLARDKDLEWDEKEEEDEDGWIVWCLLGSFHA